VLEAALKVSDRELWCAVASRVRCGSCAAAKLQWLQVVADAVRLRLAQRYMTDAGAGAVRLTLALCCVRLALAQMLYD
jgi:NADH:ubiquinone oxidoreductase subunit H